jgi:DNA (cytosine-5)-methyltransferase 1
MAQSFTFADLFAGIGGMRLAFEKFNGQCVLTSEIDKHARETYMEQDWVATKSHVFVNDVVELGNMSSDQIPKHDILIGGFPCQPYSIAGLRQGLKDEKGRGQVFLSIRDVLKKAQPKAFLLENVKGMLSHDSGKTIEFMVKQLEDQGYRVLEPTMLNSMTHANIPQNRERVFIVGLRDNVEKVTFEFPEEVKLTATLRGKLQRGKVDQKYYYDERFDCFAEIKKVVVSEETAYQWRRVYVRENKSNVCPALTANMGSGGHNVPLIKVENGIRKLTPQECANLQGFPRSFKFPKDMADAHRYHQLGNSVTVPLIERIAERLAEQLEHIPDK